MRIAVVTETYPPEINGVARTVHGFVEQLARLGHDMHLVRPQQPGVVGVAPPAGSTETLLPGAAIPRYPGLRFGLPATRRLRELWSARRPDAVYVATEGPLGHSAVTAAAQLGVPVATGFHTRFDDFVAHYGGSWLTPAVFGWMRRFHNRACATLVPTRELQSYLRARGFARVGLLARGVDTALFAPQRRDPALRAEWGLGDDDLAVIHVGRIAAEKNLDLVVSSHAAIARELPGARMVWVGDGPELARLRREHPAHVFCGARRGTDLARHFASGDLFVFPSVTETFGNVTLEALASGVPTVAFDYGAAREHLRDGSDGRRVALHDGDAFVAAALELARQPGRRAAMRVSAREAVAGLSQVSVARALVDLLVGLRERRAA
jgi:glycosyltransferase involved in cell wall biosynthesis